MKSTWDVICLGRFALQAVNLLTQVLVAYRDPPRSAGSSSRWPISVKTKFEKVEIANQKSDFALYEATTVKS